jgi:imidazoleglycerol-phosphate dehydratase / histidinol-phosphatase
MNQRKLLFIDRDGTLIEEPTDKQIDSIEKLKFLPGVIPALLQLKNAGYSFVMISNQDGLGTQSLPYENFTPPHELMLRIFESQGINFEAICICPHLPDAGCDCRKPKVGLVLDYLVKQTICREISFVIGDRETDMQFADNIGIKGIKIDPFDSLAWQKIVNKILTWPRQATVTRKTNETEIKADVNLDRQNDIKVQTGVGFLDHMIEQLAKHGGFNLTLSVKGDLEIDDHHTVEDTAIVLGETLRLALGDKRGIGRYGFLLPMDEALTQVAIDLSGRAYFVFNGEFKRDKVGDLSTELVPHFFRSFVEGLKANLHIDVKGENTHHMVESIFKAVGRALRQAIVRIDSEMPTTKGVL